MVVKAAAAVPVLVVVIMAVESVVVIEAVLEENTEHIVSGLAAVSALMCEWAFFQGVTALWSRGWVVRGQGGLGQAREAERKITCSQECWAVLWASGGSSWPST